MVAVSIYEGGQFYKFVGILDPVVAEQWKETYSVAGRQIVLTTCPVSVVLPKVIEANKETEAATDAA